MAHMMPHPGMEALQTDPAINPELGMGPNSPLNASPMQPPAPSVPRKRRKAGDGDGHPAEPRRLRRSHEACARCRSKKIKCDSKHPKCTACSSAGVPCHQEDRYRQTLTPRGHTERLERQLAQCEALLKARISGFDFSNIEDICAQEGINVPLDPNINTPYPFSPGGRLAYPPMPPPQRDGGSSPDGKNGYPPYPPMGYHPGAMYGMPLLPPPPPGSVPPPHYPYPPQLYGMPPQHYHPHMQEGESVPRPVSSPGGSQDVEVKGQDPQSLDMTTPHGLARTFGVSTSIINESGNAGHAVDREDIAVGSGGLSSGRDRTGIADYMPNEPDLWLNIQLRTGSPASPTISVWLPRDKIMLNQVVKAYFDRLNPHRPVFSKQEFDVALNTLYEQENNKGRVEDMAVYDPGFVCSLYLVLALGTLSELSHKVAAQDNVSTPSEVTTISNLPKALLPEGWPEHQELFDRALIVKADLRITISSLQALILLHFYLYIERQGRSLWRLVGHLVRLSVELGLHHDPYAQGATFTTEESQLRIRLWACVMIHDRGTSILLGRPLAIAPSDSDTPRPQHPKGKHAKWYSDHFVHSSGIVDIQADIINSLYQPKKQTADAIMRHARRITKSMTEFRNSLPDSFKPFFVGTDHLPSEKRIQVIEGIVEDNGLTLLKYWIARILLLRVLFGYKELSYQQRLTALTDAIQTAHNIIIAHNRLIRFPDCAFFVSPIPIHIAAMVILYGHMSKVDCLDRQSALEDVWMALEMLPRLRWRWERKDLNGQHPLIAKLAEKVFDVTLSHERPVNPPRLLPEMIWDADSMPQSPVISSTTHSGVTSPTRTHSMSLSSGHSQHTANGEVSAASHFPTRHHQFPHQRHHHGIQGHPFPEIPQSWFYPASDVPFGGLDRPETPADRTANEAIDMVLPNKAGQAAAMDTDANEGFLNEERDATLLPTHMNPWIQHMEQRGLQGFIQEQQRTG